VTYRDEADAPTLSPSKKHCFACATILDVRAELCPKCGVRQPSIGGAMTVTAPAPLTTTKSKTTAGLFALLLGGIGIHKFYLGQIAAGVLYLLFFWTLIPALIAFVEGIVLLGMSDAEFARKYPG
jgi:TM2 domain-containing membrane protein YozV